MSQCLKMISVRVRTKAYAPTRIYRPGPDTYATHLVPCGKCGFCLQNKRASWMFRIHHEIRTQEHRGWFITLTYDEKHVRRTALGRLSLRFRDVQKFLKRVRKGSYYCKYVCVGEYGGITARPHYHILLWTDCPIESIQSHWRMGNIHVGDVSLASAMYCLKYILQPKPLIHEDMEKPRAQFSKGLGLGYLTTRVYEWHTEGEPIFHSFIGDKRVSLPRYYRSKIFTKPQTVIHRLKTLDEVNATYSLLVLEKMVQGMSFKEAKNYLLKLQLDRSEAIVNKTKHNQII
jgi:hypothetical protein